MTDPQRSRVTVEIERMSKGPAKVTVRIDGDDSKAVAEEALQTYGALILSIEKLGEGE